MAESKIKVLYSPINTDMFLRSDPRTVLETRAEYNISADTLTFLLPSCGHKCKGLEQLLAAFSQLDPNRFDLLVAGGRLPRKIPVNVRYIGYINNLAPVYSAVDYTILPSHPGLRKFCQQTPTDHQSAYSQHQSTLSCLAFQMTNLQKSFIVHAAATYPAHTFS